MRVVVAGGKLQGIEAAYLARQAGWSVLLIDKNPSAPARGICDQFCQLDILQDSNKLERLVKSADFIIPAIEDKAVLSCLDRTAHSVGVPIACDISSYAITSSKKASDRLFIEKKIPAPRYWPQCEFPVIAKPSDMSGSMGVKKILNERDLALFFDSEDYKHNDYLIQEFLEGDSYSIEVVGCPGSYVPLQVTDLEMDAGYDCKRVLAPTKLTQDQILQFQNLSLRISELLQLTGIMDVEAINHNGVLKVLEIDARLPSQTPTAVYRSTGINMLVMLYDLYTEGQMSLPPDPCKQKGVVYEHVQITPGKVETQGEHIISQAGCINYYQDFFGADEALTNYIPGSSIWAATLIITADDRSQAWKKRCQVIENIREYFGLEYHDS
ncbi:MAG: 3-methylornithine--L-lysine ligase PylC [Thermacetogeniaceae bacterium]|jgi:pyrrolysine biosynthesis protein PylC|nr:3-methylornithine--L-lysine ligase PylC [Syntrophomonadaceae bacterium]